MNPTLPSHSSRPLAVCVTLLSLFLTGWGQLDLAAQTLFQYTNASSGAPNFVAAGASSAGLALGTGSSPVVAAVPPCGPTQGFGAQAWPTTNVFNVNTFNTNGWYITFTITPDPGNGLKINGFRAKSRRENQPGTADDGPIAIRYGYSTDGGTTWTTVNPGNPQSNNLCTSVGVNRVWPSFTSFTTSNPIIFRIYGLSSGSNLTGDMYLRDVIVEGEVCASEPDIVLGSVPAHCYSNSPITATIPYSSTTGTEYKIDIPGLGISTAYAALPPSPISFTIPGEAPAGTYSGTVTVRNTCGFEDPTPATFSLVINPLPDATVSVNSSEICAGSSIEITFNESAYPGGMFTLSATASDDNGTWPVSYSMVVDGDQITWLEGMDFTGTLAVGTVTVVNESTLCQSTTPGFSVLVNPLPTVTCPDNFEVCLSTGIIRLDLLPGLSPLSVDASSSFSGPAVTPLNFLMGQWNFSIMDAGVGTHTITYSYTDANGCTNSCEFDIKVNSIPDIAATDKTICSGTSTGLTVTNPNMVAGSTFNWVADYGAVTGGAGSATGVAFGTNAINETLVNPTNAPIVVTYTVTSFGPAPTYCEGSFFDVFVTVQPEPIFGFSASTNSDPMGDMGNNESGFADISVDFCVGDLLTLGSYTDNGPVGFVGSYITTGNVSYDGIPLSTGPEPLTIAPSGAASFFGSTYGGILGYGLTSGTFGSIQQVFTPYLDVNGNDSYDPGTDCLGEPITLYCYIYGPIEVNVVRNDNDLCSGESVDYTISTTSDQDIYVDVQLSESTNINNPADLDDDNVLPINFTIPLSSYGGPFNYTQAINNALGSFDRGRVSISVTNPRYIYTDVNCGATVNNPTPYTRIYPKPRLVNPGDQLVCTGSNTALDLDLEGLPSSNPANAGFPVRIEWTVSGVTNVSGASGGTTDIYDNAGVEIAINDIVQTLTLDNPAMPGSVTYNITPRASGPTNAFNGDDCFGDPISVTVTVVPPAEPTIEGPTCLHIGSEIVLTGNDNILAPATLVSATWSDDGSGHATVDINGVVTGFSVGMTTIYYTVLDNAGCYATATHVINVLSGLTLTSTYAGGSVVCGDEVTISVAVNGFCDVNNMSYFFEWDNSSFELVSYSTPYTHPGGGMFSLTSPMPNVLNFSFFDDFMPPYGNEIPDGTVIMTYTLRAKTSSGMHNVPDMVTIEEAYNSSLNPIPMTTTGVSIPVVPISLTLGPNPVACPSDGVAHLTFSGVMGNPNHYEIDFDGCPGFPDTQSGLLDVNDGEIIIPFMPAFVMSGSCNATLIVSDTENGCESDVYLFSIIIDPVPPTASAPAPVHVACLWQIPAPDPAVVIDEDDNCPGPLTVAYEPTLSSQTGTGCAGNPMIILRVYSVTDQAGNSITVTQMITAEDNLPPYLLEPPTLATWYGSEAAAVAAAIAHANAQKQDNCSTTAEITVALGAMPSYIGCTVTIPIVLADACGNLTTVNYTTIIDTEAPTVTAGLIDDCYDEADPDSPYGIFTFAVNAAIAATTATDDCDASLDITAATSGTDCSLTITVTATDDCGKSTSVTYLTRAENDPPQFSISTSVIEAMLFEVCFTTEAAAEDAAIALAQMYAGDDCTAPGELQFNAFTSPGCPAEVTVVVTDYCGNPAMLTFYGVHIDNEDPTVMVDPYDICYPTLGDAVAALAAAANPMDNCTASSALIAGVTETHVEVGLLEDNCHEYDITLTFTDNCGRTVSTTFPSITIDNIAPTVTPLPALTYNCVDEVDMPDIGSVSASDNCTVVDIVWIGDVLPTSCPGAGSRQYRVYDCAGNYTDVFQTIYINDNIPPSWLSAPNSLDRTTDCDDELSFLDAISLEPDAEDNCGAFDVVLLSVVPLNTCAGGLTRTWTVVDACGNQAAAPFVQTITLVDNTPPNWTVLPPDYAVECDDAAGLATALAASPLAEDNCSAVTYELVSRTYNDYGGCFFGYLGEWESIWIAKDDCDNQSMPFFHYVYIYDLTAPVWSTPESQPYPIGLDVSVSCDDPVSLAFANSLEPTATDNCDGTLTYTKVSGSFMPGACLGEGTITNTWTATDDCGNVGPVFTQTITITDNTPPSFDPLCQFVPLTIKTSDGYDCPETATISGLMVGDEIDNMYSWNVAGLIVPPLGSCVFDNCVPSSAIIIKVVAIEDVYNPANCSRTITLRFELRDPCGNVQPELFVYIYNIIDDMAPSVSSGSIGSCYNSEAAAFAAAIAVTSASDDCTLPANLTMTASRTGTLCNATITVTATDCAGNSASVNYNTRIDGDGPTMTAGILATCHPSIAAAQAAAIAATTITDNCTSYGSMMIIANTVGTCPATVTVTATDECGNSNSIAYPGLCIGAGSSVMITTPASDGSAVCEEVADGIALWLANHGGATATGLGVTWSYSPADPLAVLLAAAPNCGTHSKTVLVTFTATDNCGYTATTTAYFSVTDNTPPTVNPIPATSLTCSTGIPAPNPAIVTGASDNCGTPTVTLFGSSDNGDTGCPGNPRIIVHTYAVTDQYCNTTYVTHTITVVDNVPPTFTAPANITINVNAACTYDASTAVTGDVTDEDDNCSTGLNAVYTDNVTPGDEFQVKYVILRTWTLVDACGNAAIPRTQVITVKDVTPPTLSGCPSGNVDLPGSIIESACGAYASALTNPLFSDNCSASISYELSGATTGSGVGYVPPTQVFAEGTTTITYTVEDEVGNAVSCSFTVTVNCLSIEGRIIWEHDKASGVKDATVNVTRVAPAFAGSDLSDTNGDYNVAVPNAGTYTVKPVKNINRFNGVTSADVTAIQNHVGGIVLITDPYKKVCADVNRSGTITSQDATILSQALMGNPTALAIFNVFWRFVPTDYAMPATPPASVPAFPEQKNVTVTTMDAVGIDFYGMKIGDVAAPWADPQMKPDLQPLVWTVYDQNLVAGTEVEVTFTASNFADLSSYIMGLDFDPSVLKFVGFQPLGALPMNLNDNFGAFNANLGQLRHLWAGTQSTSLPNGTQVFRAKFKVLRSGQKLSQVLRLDESEIECKAYYADPLMPVDMKLVFVESVNTGSPVDPSRLSLQLLQNRPNPFTDRTVIGFILPETCNAQIRILDISGRELANYDRLYSAGYHELEFRLPNAALYGMLYCELTTPQGTRTIKMIAVH